MRPSSTRDNKNSTYSPNINYNYDSCQYEYPTIKKDKEKRDKLIKNKIKAQNYKHKNKPKF